MPTSTILFPELNATSTQVLYPDASGYESSPQPGQLAAVETDTGAEQVRKRRDVLMQFKYRTVITPVTETRAYNTFLDTCGAGDVNFTFYEPYALHYGLLEVAITDGTDTMYIGWRGLDSWTEIYVDGSNLINVEVTNEFVSPTKEDRIVFPDTAPPAGQSVEFENVYARKRHICRMQSWRRYPYQGGAIPAELFQPAFPTTVPLFPMVYEFNFREKG